MKKVLYGFFGLYVIFMVFCLVIIMTSCSYVNRYFGLEDDNIAEETIEYVIGSEDLTAQSPE